MRTAQFPPRRVRAFHSHGHDCEVGGVRGAQSVGWATRKRHGARIASCSPHHVPLHSPRRTAQPPQPRSHCTHRRYRRSTRTLLPPHWRSICPPPPPPHTHTHTSQIRSSSSPSAKQAQPSTWTLLDEGKTGNRPLGRQAATSHYCEPLDRYVVFGGFSADANFLGDTWYYDFNATAWRYQEFPNGQSQPAGRASHTLVLMDSSPVRCRYIAFGGALRMGRNSLADLRDAWVLTMTATGASWTQVSITTPSELQPNARNEHAAVWRRGKMYIYSGLTSIDGQLYSVLNNDMWELTISEGAGPSFSGSWEQVSWVSANGDSQPFSSGSGSGDDIPKERFSMAWDLVLGDTAAEDRLIVYGGRKLDSSSTADYSMLSDLWLYNFETRRWTQAQGTNVARSYHTVTTHNGMLYSFGGYTRVLSNRQYNGYVFNDVLVTDLAGGGGVDKPGCTDTAGAKDLWCEVDLPSIHLEPGPQVRFSHTAARRGDHFIVYSGRFNDMHNDLWALNLTRALQFTVVADASYLGGSDLQSAMYFMVAILVMMIVCFFVFIVSLRRQREGGGHSALLGGAAAGGMRGAAQRGVRLSVIRALPTVKYTKGMSSASSFLHQGARTDAAAAVEAGEVSLDVEAPAPASEPRASSDRGAESKSPDGDGEDEELCPICLVDYDEGDTLQLLPCGHFYHPECIEQWLTNKNSCPMCKQVVAQDAAEEVDDAHGGDVALTVVAAAGPQPTGAETTITVTTAAAADAEQEQLPDPRPPPAAGAAASAAAAD